MYKLHPSFQVNVSLSNHISTSMQRQESDSNVKQKDKRIEKQLVTHTTSKYIINHNDPIKTPKPTHLHRLHNPTTYVCKCNYTWLSWSHFKVYQNNNLNWGCFIYKTTHNANSFLLPPCILIHKSIIWYQSDLLASEKKRRCHCRLS